MLLDRGSKVRSNKAVLIVEDISNEINVLHESCQPLYLGAWSTMLASTLLLMNTCTIHGVSNKFTNQLLALLHRHLLPKDNCLPPNMYIIKNLTTKVGLYHKNIHACANGCVIFRMQYATLKSCPKYGADRFKAYGKF
jgi:hypothetical protein